jgi:L-ribulose-5-phosphate 3-epimerase
MNARIGRRQFLEAAGVASTAPTWVTALARSANEDIPSSSRARLFSGCCALSFEKLLMSGRMTMEQFIGKAVEYGIDGVDMTTYYLKSTHPDYLYSLRHLAFKSGVHFSGAAAGTQMSESDHAKRASAIAEIKRWVDVTESLGAADLRVFCYLVTPGSADVQNMQYVVETMKPACDYAAQKGITVGIENHGGVTSKAENVLEILRRVDSPYAGCNLDITHFEEDKYAQMGMLVPYATHTHIRERFDRGQPIDLDRVWNMFAQSEYKGYMPAQYAGAEDPLTAVPALLTRIKELCWKHSSTSR